MYAYSLNGINSPLTETKPANNFVGIDQKIVYGKDKKAVLPLSAGILDTGTTLILIASGTYPAMLLL